MIFISVPTFVDLFAGIGGFRLGLENIGYECLYSIEIDKHCRKVYYDNFGGMPDGDIRQIHEKEIPPHDILCAGFPCQPFSIASSSKLGLADTRGTLFFDIMRIIRYHHPRVIVLENVKNLRYHDKGNTMLVILNLLQKEGYWVSWDILNARDFGVPQNRERIIIVAQKNKYFNFDNIRKTPVWQLKDFLDDNYTEYLPTSEYTLIKAPQKQPSGLIFAGYRNKSIRKRGVLPNTLHLSRVHKQPNRIYDAQGIHPTLSSQESSGRYFVLIKDKVRKLTIQECFRIMGFPDSFIKKVPQSQLYKQIGNSVCVPMVEEIGKHLYASCNSGLKVKLG